jgi:hypothetical protein
MLPGCVGDSHLQLYNALDVLYSKPLCTLPVYFRFVEGEKVVVSANGVGA